MTTTVKTVRFDVESDKDILTAWATKPNSSEWLKNVLRESLKPPVQKPESEPQIKAEPPVSATAAPPAPPDSKDDLSDEELEKFIALQLEKEKAATVPEGGQSKADSSGGKNPAANPAQAPPAPAQVMPPNFYCENGHPLGFFNPMASNVVELIRGAGKCQTCGSNTGDFK